MKFIISTILTALLCFVLGLYLPWWSIAIGAFIVALAVHQAGWKAFLSGFISLFLLWSGHAWLISEANEGLLAKKISVLILNIENPFLLILVTGLTGALVAGLAAVTGSLARKIV
ncbi:hypothetical protein [Flavihumibacter cheonanensis]|uniref:hypothetical protein n=1 Tax=Flavihumibacter cheonanensis TaxID=1442385 RepID=UPI001EF978B6|nr:hypothetical protein [Flavihumibacter cheonanensis]MCG7751237.1 hypothetical protein [Flavihumibacter cheonanensis]